MTLTRRYTIHDLEGLDESDNGTRHEIIDGELHVSTQPDNMHQMTVGLFFRHLDRWSESMDAGRLYFAPGVIFAPDEAVAPDLAWVSRDRIAVTGGDDNKFRAAPDLVVEVLSPGTRNEKRDLVLKLDQYSRYGVREYWVADWRDRTVRVHRRQDAQLRLIATLTTDDALTSPLLPGFEAGVADLFAPPGPR